MVLRYLVRTIYTFLCIYVYIICAFLDFPISQTFVKAHCLGNLISELQLSGKCSNMTKQMFLVAKAKKFGHVCTVYVFYAFAGWS